MSTAQRLENYLLVTQTPYDVVDHRHSATAIESARVAHVQTRQVVKAVLLRDTDTGDYLMALAPASHRLNLSWLDESQHHHYELAREDELGPLFPDCEVGAVPGFGQAYALNMVWDDELAEPDELYFEAGDHVGLVKIEHHDFLQLFGTYPHATISAPTSPPRKPTPAFSTQP